MREQRPRFMTSGAWKIEQQQQPQSLVKVLLLLLLISYNLVAWIRIKDHDRSSLSSFNLFQGMNHHNINDSNSNNDTNGSRRRRHPVKNSTTHQTIDEHGSNTTTNPRQQDPPTYGLSNNHNYNSIYYNLSCPLELHRFSCVFQGRTQKAQHARALVELQWNSLLQQLRNDPQPLLDDQQRLFLLGDSLVRQVFSGLGCLLHAAGYLEDYMVNWSTPPLRMNGRSRCDNHTYHCIESGVHSRFSEGVLVLKNFHLHNNNNGTHNRRAEIHYRSVDRASVAYEFWHQLNRTNRLFLRVSPTLQQWRKRKPQPSTSLLLSRRPDVMPLTDRDILCLTVGVHDEKDDNDRKPTDQNIYQTVGLLSRRLRQLPGGVPKFWYMTTSTQHFLTSTGEYEHHNRTTDRLVNEFPNANASHIDQQIEQDLRHCRSTVEVNPRRDQELLYIRDAAEHVIDYGGMDQGWGGHHLDLLASHLHDCTHYCQPGPPDVAAMQLVQSLQSYYAQS